MILKEKERLSKPYEEVIEQNEEIIEPQKIKKEKNS